MTASFGITGYGAYIPRKRMSRQAIFDAVGWAQGSLSAFTKGARAYAQWDEDAVTMCVEAARAALHGPPATLCFASTTAPFLDRQNATILAAALDAPRDTHCFDMSGSQRAGLSALIALSKDRASRSLVAAADKRPVKAASALEMLAGEAGAAIALGPEASVAEWVGAHSIAADFVDHYRTAASETDYALEERWVRDAGLIPMAKAAVDPLMARAGVKIADIAHAVVATPNPALARAVSDALGAGAAAFADPLFDQCGYAGAAHPLLVLAATLEKAKPGDLILVLAFGQGCDAVLLRAIGRMPSRGASVAGQLKQASIETSYAKFLAAGGRLDIDWGMRAERDNRTAQTVAYLKSRDIYGLVGGVCSACDTPQFPKSRRCVNPDCAALDTQSDYRFADRRGAIKTYTEDYLAFTRAPPLLYGNVSFEGGGNMFIEVTDFDPGEAAVGAAVDMRFRIKDIDEVRGFHRYFWKAAPARSDLHG